MFPSLVALKNLLLIPSNLETTNAPQTEKLAHWHPLPAGTPAGTPTTHNVLRAAAHLLTDWTGSILLKFNLCSLRQPPMKWWNSNHELILLILKPHNGSLANPPKENKPTTSEKGFFPERFPLGNWNNLSNSKNFLSSNSGTFLTPKTDLTK